MAYDTRLELRIDALAARRPSRIKRKIFDVTGRPMKGWLLVDPRGFADLPALQRWLVIGWGYASALPPKGMPE